MKHKDIDLEKLIEQAAKSGAKKALAEIGLDDKTAKKDLRDLRDLLASWQRIRQEASKSIIIFGVRAVLIFMLLMAAVIISTGIGQ